MTVIAWDGKTLAADKQSTWVGLRRTATKIFAGYECLYAISGDAAIAMAMLEWHRAVCNLLTRRLMSTIDLSTLMLEALILGAVGSVLGIMTGILLARALIAMIADAMGVVFQLRFLIESLTISAGAQVSIGAIGIGAALVASVFAARAVAAFEPVQVMRGASADVDTRQPPRRLVMLWAMLVLASIGALVLEVRWHSIVWGNVGSTLWNASVFAIAIPLVTWSAAILRRHVLLRELGVHALEPRVLGFQLLHPPQLGDRRAGILRPPHEAGARLIPYRRSRSATGTPASPSFTIATICSSVIATSTCALRRSAPGSLLTHGIRAGELTHRSTRQLGCRAPAR